MVGIKRDHIRFSGLVHMHNHHGSAGALVVIYRIHRECWQLSIIIRIHDLNGFLDECRSFRKQIVERTGTLRNKFLRSLFSGLHGLTHVDLPCDCVVTLLGMVRSTADLLCYPGIVLGSTKVVNIVRFDCRNLGTRSIWRSNIPFTGIVVCDDNGVLLCCGSNTKQILHRCGILLECNIRDGKQLCVVPCIARDKAICYTVVIISKNDPVSIRRLNVRGIKMCDSGICTCYRISSDLRPCVICYVVLCVEGDNF